LFTIIYALIMNKDIVKGFTGKILKR
jgi:hypothetical protein